MKKNVAVLMGGYSSEHDISVKSGNTVYNNIDTNNFIPFKIIVEKEKRKKIEKKIENDEVIKEFAKIKKPLKDEKAKQLSEY